MTDAAIHAFWPPTRPPPPPLAHPGGRMCFQKGLWPGSDGSDRLGDAQSSKPPTYFAVEVHLVVKNLPKVCLAAAVRPEDNCPRPARLADRPEPLETQVTCLSLLFRSQDRNIHQSRRPNVSDKLRAASLLVLECRQDSADPGVAYDGNHLAVNDIVGRHSATHFFRRPLHNIVPFLIKHRSDSVHNTLSPPANKVIIFAGTMQRNSKARKYS